MPVMRTELRRLVLTRRRAQVARRARWYATTDPRTATSWQAARLDEVWAEALASQPFYRYWQKAHELPDRIGSLAEFAEFPALTKGHLRDHQDLVFAHADPRRTYSTGGSTGAPVRFPRGGRSEADERYASGGVSRSWWGVEPGDRYVHLWGHGDYIGSGARATWHRYKRLLADYVLGAVRLNAYDVSDEVLEQQCRSILRADPQLIVAYASSIYRVARHANAHGYDMRRLGALKAVLATADTSSDTDRELIESTFGVPLINEYGSSEMGPIAVSHESTWPLRVLWDTVLVTHNEGSLRVTSLHARAFPLINYEMGDEAVDLKRVAGSVLEIGQVKGRTQEIVRFRSTDGTVVAIHTMLPVHIFKTLPEIRSVQVQQRGRVVALLVTADSRVVPGELKTYFVEQLAKEHQGIDASCITVEQIDRPVLTPRGKQLFLIGEDAHPGSGAAPDASGR